MAIAYDATGAGASVSAGSSLSYTHTATAGATVILWLQWATGGADTITVTYGGTTMPQVGSTLQYQVFGNSFNLSCYALSGVAGGAQTVSISFSASTYANANSVSYTGVGTLPSTLTTNSGSANTMTLSVSSTSGDLINQCFAGGYAASGGFTGYNQTSRYNAYAGLAWAEPFLIGDAAGGSSVSFSASSGTPGVFWGAAAVDLPPAAVNAAAALTGTGALSAKVGAKVTTVTLTGHITPTAKIAGKIGTSSAGHGVLSAGVKARMTVDPLGHGALTATAIPVGSTRNAALTGTGALIGNAVGLDVSIVAGQLEIVATNTYYTLQSQDLYDLTNSFALAECVVTPNSSDGTTEALLYAFAAPTLGAGWVVRIGFSGGNFICDDNTGSGSTMTVRYSATFNTSTHRWWRIRQAAATLFWEYSGDSVTWTGAASQPITAVADVYVGLICGCGPSATAPGRAVFDNFNVTAITPTLTGHGALSATTGRIPARLAGHGVLSAGAGSKAGLRGHGALTGKIACAVPAVLHGHGTLARKAIQTVALAGHGALTVVLAGPKTFTLYDDFATENTGKWAGWSVASLGASFLAMRAPRDYTVPLTGVGTLAATATPPSARRVLTVPASSRLLTLTGRR